MREIAAGTMPVYRLLAARTTKSWGFRVTAVLGALTTVGGLLFLTVVRGTHAGTESGALHVLPNFFAQCMCWGIATLTVFATGQRAFLRDHEDGIRDLLRTRGADAHYRVARTFVAITSAALISVVFTGILGIACGLAATGTSEAAATWKGAGSALVYAALFAVVMGSLALSVLGGRGRGGGYLGLLLVLVLPELLAPLTSRALPAQMGAALPMSIPDVLRSVSAPASAMNFIAGVCTTVIVVGIAIAYARRECARVDGEMSVGT